MATKFNLFAFTIFACLIFCNAPIVQGQKYYKTPSGAKYHLGDCRMVNNVSEEVSAQQIIELGLTACKICKPENINRLNLKSNTPRGKLNTVQCMGITKAGTRCKHMTSLANGYCFQHNPDR